ncbi:VWA domain-containing protein [Prosthecochloris sp. ZM_2]|uniref:vWA domain-containing protein n=1 Tax=Prosthecochloris sp. ZM_2 TaxID=2045206 RepID=UPI00131427A3|nr:VWA domain-containing protein [Prosthecochloris sp. ZM_2]
MCFGSPHYLGFLWLLLPLAALQVYGIVTRRRAVRQLCDRRCEPAVFGRFSPAGETAIVVMQLAALSLVLVAAARPQWCTGERLVRLERVETAYVLDVSSSMKARDVLPDRLARVQDELLLISRGDGGGRRSLVVFAGTAAVQCPLTSDRRMFETFLRLAGPDVVARQGTDIAAALEVALRSLGDGRDARRRIVLASDGGYHRGDAPALARLLRHEGVGLMIVAAGDTVPVTVPAPVGDDGGGVLRDAGGHPVMSRLEPERLRELAGEAGGKLFTSGPGRRAAPLVLAEMDREQTSSRLVRVPLHREDIPALFVLPALVLLLVSGLVRCRRVP